MSTSLSEINVIPLVDVMLVLLIIFMVAAPMLQRGVEVNLPVARERAEDDRGADVRDRAALLPQGRKVFLDDEQVSREVLTERMRQMMQGKEQKELFLRGDGGVQLQELMDVMGQLKDAGVERVGIVTVPADPRKGRR